MVITPLTVIDFGIWQDEWKGKKVLCIKFGSENLLLVRVRICSLEIYFC
jgi:hypothetical protein